MIKKERYLKFSIIVLDSDNVAWLNDLVGDVFEIVARKEEPDYIYDNLLGACAPFTYLLPQKGDLGLGMGDYEW